MVEQQEKKSDPSWRCCTRTRRGDEVYYDVIKIVPTIHIFIAPTHMHTI